MPISPYGVSKLAAERYVAVYSQLYAMPCSSVRLFSAYGPRQRKQVVYDLLDRLRRDPERLEVMGDGTQARDFVFVEDVAAAMISVAERVPGAGEVYNVASGTTHSIAQLVDGSCEVLDVQPEITYTGSVRPGDADRWAVDTTDRCGRSGSRRRRRWWPGSRKTLDWYRAARRAPRRDARDPSSRGPLTWRRCASPSPTS